MRLHWPLCPLGFGGSLLSKLCFKIEALISQSASLHPQLLQTRLTIHDSRLIIHNSSHKPFTGSTGAKLALLPRELLANR